MADPREHLRAADADRQAVADRLRAALDEGRLGFHEYDERLREAYQAKTYGDLAGLVGDLPGTVPLERSGLAPLSPPGVPGLPGATGPPGQAGTAGSSAATDAPFSGTTRRWLIATWDDYFGAVSVCVVIWLLIGVTSDNWAGLWPLWVAGPWGTYLAYETAKGLATGEPQRWAVKQERKRAAKLAQREKNRALGRADPEDDPDGAST